MSNLKTVDPISAQFVRAIAGQRKKNEDASLLNMEFPTLEEMEMDVPILNAKLQQARVAPDDDENLEMQFMTYFDMGMNLSLPR